MVVSSDRPARQHCFTNSSMKIGSVDIIGCIVEGVTEVSTEEARKLAGMGRRV